MVGGGGENGIQTGGKGGKNKERERNRRTALSGSITVDSARGM